MFSAVRGSGSETVSAFSAPAPFWPVLASMKFCDQPIEASTKRRIPIPTKTFKFLIRNLYLPSGIIRNEVILPVRDAVNLKRNLILYAFSNQVILIDLFKKYFKRFD
jgi:hypothetical protein